jgi:hypothetical protein
VAAVNLGHTFVTAVVLQPRVTTVVVFASDKIMRKNPDPEYYNKKRLKIKVRTAHNKRQLGQRNQVEIKILYNEVLKAKKLHRRQYVICNEK